MKRLNRESRTQLVGNFVDQVLPYPNWYENPHAGNVTQAAHGFPAESSESEMDVTHDTHGPLVPRQRQQRTKPMVVNVSNQQNVMGSQRANQQGFGQLGHQRPFTGQTCGAGARPKQINKPPHQTQSDPCIEQNAPNGSTSNLNTQRQRLVNRGTQGMDNRQRHQKKPSRSKNSKPAHDESGETVEEAFAELPGGNDVTSDDYSDLGIMNISHSTSMSSSENASDMEES
ncbi:hypothetical protein V1264_022487 [Littorina saxatilis]|uniref:Uncharacterized protein n=1 Tax=Littorina saxatilis TaxID=31220 RepID=A0AAN9AKL9_9CAEN